MVYPDSNQDSYRSSSALACPNCGVTLRSHQVQAGRRLARCWNCGQMLRMVRKLKAQWSGDATLDWRNATAKLPELPALSDMGVQLEKVALYPYPNIQCPNCEHVNRDNDSVPLYCVNCAADLKKSCVVCNQPLYILDQFCSNCRNDQERAQIELEAYYWQRYNEAKRLAEQGRWAEAQTGFDLFFSPDWPEDFEAQRYYRQARHIYKTSIAPNDNNAGPKLYGQVLDMRHKSAETAIKHSRKGVRWRLMLSVACILIAAFWSAANLGSWWAIFVIAPIAGLLLAALLIGLLMSIGLG